MNPLLPCLVLLVGLLPACTPNERYSAAREWQRNECNRVIDKEDRDRCLKRVEDAYGSGARDSRTDPPKR